MFTKLLPSKAFAALLVGGTLAATQLVGPTSTVTASPELERVAYPAKVSTTTDLRLDRRVVRRGQRNVARVRVSAETGTPQGTVTIKVAGRQYVERLRDGRASHALPRYLRANRTYRVVAVYNGNKLFKKSSDEAYFTVKKRGGGQVAGVEGSRGDNDENGAANGGSDNGAGANRAATVAGVATGLGDTGAESNTELYALAGLGLLGAGGAAIAVNRRRSRA